MLLLVYVLNIGFFCFMDPGPHPSRKTELLWSVWSRRARPRSCAEVFLTLMCKTGVKSQHEIMKTIFDLKKKSMFDLFWLCCLVSSTFQRNCHIRHVWDCVSKSREIPIWCFFSSLRLGLYKYYWTTSDKCMMAMEHHARTLGRKNALHVLNQNINLPLTQFSSCNID